VKTKGAHACVGWLRENFKKCFQEGTDIMEDGDV